MIIKTISSKLYIHPFLYILILIFLLTGRIYNLILFMSLITIHELGHFITAIFLKWKVDKIYLYPLGGISKFNELINVKLKEELLVMIMGPITQFIFYLLLKNIISYKYIEIFTNYNYLLLIFNLLPIYPLDGGKLLNIVFNYFKSYKSSLSLILIISFIIEGILISVSIISKSVFFIIVVLSLFLKLNKEFNLRYNYFNKFILERYLYNFKIRKKIIVKDIYGFRRDRTHLIIKNGNLINEKAYLIEYFNKKKLDF